MEWDVIDFFIKTIWLCILLWNSSNVVFGFIMEECADYYQVVGKEARFAPKQFKPKHLLGHLGDIKAIGFERGADKLGVPARLSTQARAVLFFGAIVTFSDIGTRQAIMLLFQTEQVFINLSALRQNQLLGNIQR